ncbi:MAG: UvrD-helicase domain-containing protein [Bacteroidales bacterium]|nr:UvrD-helicase domain-containing protein [Bacteroidales bacterium]
MKKILYISAGAGSGKTTSVVNMLVDILKNNHTINTSDIMMTTFSRAAAFEMRERTRQGLLEAHLVEKASELDAASIGTIHSVCLKFLQKYWYLAGISPESKQLEEDDFNLFADRSINELVSDKDMQQFEEWRKNLDITSGMYHDDDTTYWRKLLKKMVEKVRYYNIQDLTESRKLSVEEVLHCFANHQFNPTVYDVLKEEDVKQSGELTANAIKRLNKIDSYKPVDSKFEDFPSSSASFVKDISKKMELYVKSARVFTNDKRDILVAVVNKLFDILEIWRTNFDTFKKENHLLDYNDMELLFRNLLQESEVREEISNRYKLIMVDEYQDCNTVQVDIFKKLSELMADNSPLEHSSVWVGDYKQAIYGFRGSDTELTKSVGDQIHTYENSKVPGFETRALQYSYRSRAELVKLANDIFLPIFSGPNYNMLEDEIVLNVGRKPGKNPSDDIDPKQKSALYWNFIQSKSEDRLMEFTSQIKAMVESSKYKVQPKKGGGPRPLQYEDIAVLCRNNEVVSKLANCMQNAGIPVCAPEADTFSRIEVQLMLALLQYAKEPKFRRHLRLDIIHILKNEPTETILNDYVEYVHDKITKKIKNGRTYREFPKEWRNDDELVQLLETISKECYAKNMHDTLATFVDRMRLMDVVNRWGDAETRKDNITNLLQKAAKFDTHCENMERKDDQQRFSKFSQYLIETAKKAEQSLERKAVKVITYHKSKGLDWPMVALYELNNSTFDVKKVSEREFIGVREQKKITGDYWLRVFPPMGKMLDKFAAQILSEEPYFKDSWKRLQKEETRLFYVGVTRARDILVFATENKNNWLDTILQSGSGKDAMRYDNLVHRLHKEYFESENKEVETENVCEYQEIDIQKLKTEVVASPHLLNPSKVNSSDMKYNVDVVEVKDAAFPVEKTEEIRMNTIGSCIHNIYAAYNPDIEETETVKMAENIIKAYGLNGVVDASKVIKAIKLLYGQLIDRFGEPKSVGHEVPFTLLMENDQLLHGEIDLLWETQDGVVLVDFKNIESEVPNPEHYFAQMSAYEKAINAAGKNCRAIVLYYANHGKMVVLDKH